VTPFAVSVVITEPSDAVRVSDAADEAFVFVTFTFDAFVFVTTVEFALFALEVSEFCPHPAATEASASAHAPHKSLFITSLLSSVVWT
jgi:hypothetical protein